ncbi:hypothetical protein BHM03_00014383 [Ensete ventricosum]|nr:hypothetical protein BHM03_00014383 [Ensete ventricosum]
MGKRYATSRHWSLKVYLGCRETYGGRKEKRLLPTCYWLSYSGPNGAHDRTQPRSKDGGDVVTVEEEQWSSKRKRKRQKPATLIGMCRSERRAGPATARVVGAS